MFIESGPATVIESGTATTWHGHGLTLVVRLPEDNLVVEFAFDDGDPANPRVETSETDVGYRLTCVGFDDAAGRGTSEPMLLGEIGEDLLFLHFRVFRYGDTVDRTLHYTVYRCAKARLDWSPVR